MNNEANLVPLPDDSQALKAMLRTLMREREDKKQSAETQRQRAEAQQKRAEEQQHWAEELQVELLRVQVELERYKKWYYGLVLIACNRPPIWHSCF